MVKDEKKVIIKTVILCFIILWMTFSKFLGFILGFLLIFLIPSLFVNLYFIFIKKQNKQRRIIQTALWVLTYVISISHHIYLHQTTRNLAQDVANSVIAYQEKNGNYPNDYEMLGYDKKELHKHYLFYKYPNKNNQYPMLVYSKTWIPFEAYYFDFKTQQWKGD